MSTLEDLLDRLDATRERTLVALETLPDEALMTPGVIGRWSVADLLSILTAWDSEVVTGLLRLKQGKSPENLLAAVANPDRYNAARFEDAQGRLLDVIFEDFQGARLHLEEWLSELTESALSNPKHYKALGGQSLFRIIARATYEHEGRYLPFLTSFAGRWQPEEATELETIPRAGNEIPDPAYADGLLSANGHGEELPDDDDDD
ncbi:MAG TPA: DinB family protein [Promineifilum sp.]